MNKNNYVVIMAGGIGSRFWPLSKKTYPKQFHDILGVGKSLLQLTYERFERIVPSENIFVITNSSYSLLVNDQLPNLPEKNILTEPAAMNTAPCVAYASFKLFCLNEKANVIFAPSDHLITNEFKFDSDIKEALTFTETNSALVTLSIKPTRPDTGYGYIQFIEKEKNENIHKVKTFTEKPSHELALTFMESGDFYWNSGIFIWKASDILNEFNLHQTDIYDLFKKGLKYYNTAKEQTFINKQYPLCKSISIDYAVMEKTKIAYTLPTEFGWSDIGTWKSLYHLRDKDENNNMVHSKNNQIYNTKDSLIFMESNPEKLVVIEGLEGVMVIDTDEILFISHLDREQEVREITKDIKDKYKGKFI